MTKTKELIELEHKLRMEQIKYQFDLNIKLEQVKIEHQKEMQRIRSADIQRNQQRRSY